VYVVYCLIIQEGRVKIQFRTWIFNIICSCSPFLWSSVSWGERGLFVFIVMVELLTFTVKTVFS